MAYFFDGRLWTTPAVMSRVDDSAMFNPNVNVGNVLAVIGRSTDGKPNTALSFGSPEQAKAALVSGDLVDAISRAFNASAETAGPLTVIGVRVNPALQASYTLLDASSGQSIVLTSTGYGKRNNQIKVKVEAATTRGLKLTTQFGTSYFSQDNIYRNAFTIRYAGAQASARMTVSNTQVILEAPNSTVVATIELADYPTVQELVDRINAVIGFTATVNDGNGNKPTLNGLDAVSNQDVRTADFIAKGDLQAAIDWFNGVGEGYINATRPVGGTLPPAVMPFKYLSGGSDGTVTNTEWSNAFTTLQSVDTQWVVPLSSAADIHAMADAHCAYMSGAARRERRAICGAPLATSDAAAIALAKALNSDRTSITHLGGYDFNAAGDLVLYEPYIVAAMIAGAFAGLNPGTPMTNKSLRLRGLERKLRNPTDTDDLIEGGVLCVEDTPTGYRVVKSISTWLTNDNFNRVEQSVGVALDFTARAVRQAVSGLIGAKGSPTTMTLAKTRVETALAELARPEPAGVGVLVGDVASPPYKNVNVTLSGDVMAISFQCSPVVPVNYIPVTIYAVPYSGSASV